MHYTIESISKGGALSGEILSHASVYVRQLLFKERFHSLATWPEVDFQSSQKVQSTSLGAIFDSWSIGDIYFSLRQLLPCQIKHFLPKSGSENLVSSPNNPCSCWGGSKIAQIGLWMYNRMFYDTYGSEKVFSSFFLTTTWKNTEILDQKSMLQCEKFKAWNQHFWSENRAKLIFLISNFIKNKS